MILNADNDLDQGHFRRPDKSRQTLMRKIIFLLEAAVLALATTGGALAMGGGGNLSPSQSPYAILEPQTVAPLPAPASESVEPSVPRVAKHHGKKVR